MKKRLIIFIMLAMAIFCIKFESFSQTVPTKPICEFFSIYKQIIVPPYLHVYYDAREYNEKWFDSAQRNTGGVKFVIEASHLTPEERDAMVSTIKSVIYTNLTKGTSYKLKNARKYVYVRADGTRLYQAAYEIWLGHLNNYIGHWKVEVLATPPNSKGKIVSNTYATEFELTEELMLERPSTAAIEEISVATIDGNYEVCFSPIDPADIYRVRIVEGNDVIYDTPFIGHNSTICHAIPGEHYGKLGRIEAYLHYGFYLACPSNTLTIGMRSRVCTNFLLVP